MVGLTLKYPFPVPENVTPLMLSAPVPVLFTVTVSVLLCPAVIVPNAWLASTSISGTAAATDPVSATVTCVVPPPLTVTFPLYVPALALDFSRT